MPTKKERIKRKIENDKSLNKQLASVNYYDAERFFEDGKFWIKAITQEKMLCSIPSVSKSGMSRTMKFASCEKNNHRSGFYYRNYWGFMSALGYQRNGDAFRIHGCGMDMVFNTNYNIIHDLHSLGFISKKQCDNLAQKTPVVI